MVIVDDKIVVVPADNRDDDRIQSLDDIPQLVKQLEHHFTHYKDLKKPGRLKVLGWGDVDEAKQIINECIKRDTVIGFVRGIMDTTYQTPTYESSSTMTPAESTAMAGFMILYWVVMLVSTVVTVVSMWKLFTKAGKPGWASIVPIYNNIVQLEIAGRPAWWVLLSCLSHSLMFGYRISMIDFVRSYQRSGLWVIGFMLAPVIALPWFAFSSKTQYRGPVAAGRTDFMPVPVPTTAPAQPVYATPAAPEQPTPPSSPQV